MDWTLSENDKSEVGKYHTGFRLFVAIQLCSVRLYGRFLNDIHDLSPRIVSYLNGQLDLPSSLRKTICCTIARSCRVLLSWRDALSMSLLRSMLRSLSHLINDSHPNYAKPLASYSSCRKGSNSLPLPS
jgi:hypothetical protein